MMKITFETYRVVNNVRTTTGLLFQDVYLYSYASQDQSIFAYQIGLASLSTSWGDATRATMTGRTRADGECTTAGASFPAQPVFPPNLLRVGESLFSTKATAPGAIGFCNVWWDVVYNVPGYSTAVAEAGMNDVRCDNATGGYLNFPVRVGCVVPWYPYPAYYFSSRNPTLADHVLRAQGSGLPGADVTTPLFRTTDPFIEGENRRLACGSPPSIPGKSCDEYPLASTRNGLWSGGTLRSFPGCNINAPTTTGPTGASACMINAGDNNAQGGIMSGFYYFQRVLDRDPYIVTVI